ncbi:RHTO0S06e02762g1_1 [Rhodotorula toruloides]|uniref:RHTO0S06e02762g1_1 n=1 Tax=Rhodotorula toruloides TaxID=5286 RepID=A0A061B1P6_RHOTO|nr:RHTO0S06e02762g1_1 [Rhodotorula toruloides]
MRITDWMHTTGSSGVLVALAFFPAVYAHMSIWHPSMYGVGPGFSYDGGNPVDPIGPGVAKQSDWWFRGPSYRALKPQNGSVMDLPAGGSVTIEITCHLVHSSYGTQTSDPNDPLSACPNGYGPHHAGDPAGPIVENLVSRCALGVADKDDDEKVGWDDIVIFSVTHRCVRQRLTTFKIPDRMPACSGSKCICGWFWLANNGTANFYMTAFDCRFTDVKSSKARALLPPVDPAFCPTGNTTCQPAKGAKRPLYAYNTPTNVVWQGNDARPGYHQSWSFGEDGAQEDIFSDKAPGQSGGAVASGDRPVAASSPSISPSSAASAMAVSSSPSPSPDPSSSSSASTAPSTSILGLPRPSSTFLPRPCRRNCPHPPSRRLSRLSPKVNIPTGSYGFASEVVDALAWTKQQHGERDERSRDGDGRRGKGLVGS